MSTDFLHFFVKKCKKNVGSLAIMHRVFFATYLKRFKYFY